VADVQLEHGYTRIANELLEALARAALPPRHLRVVLALARMTYGYNKAEDRIAASQISALTGIEERNVRHVLGDLRAALILESRGSPGQTQTWRIQKDHELWTTLPDEPGSHGRKSTHPRREQPGSAPTRVSPDARRDRPDTRVGIDPATRVSPDAHQRQKDILPKTESPAGSARTRRKAPRKPAEPRPPKPGQLAVSVYCEEFEAAKRAKAAPAPHHCKALRELVELHGLDPERVRAAARVFFADQDEWLKKVSYHLGAFVERFQQCDMRAQKRAQLEPLKVPQAPTPELTAEERDRVAAIFGAALGGKPRA
jgi:phage replication O-like protein O